MNMDSPGQIRKTTIQAPPPPCLTKKYLRLQLGISVADRRGRLFRMFEADGIFTQLPQVLAEWRERREFTRAESRVIMEVWKL